MKKCKNNFKYFEMSLQYFEEKNIFLSQYLFIAILCAKMSCVNKALISLKFFEGA